MSMVAATHQIVSSSGGGECPQGVFTITNMTDSVYDMGAGTPFDPMPSLIRSQVIVNEIGVDGCQLVNIINEVYNDFLISLPWPDQSSFEWLSFQNTMHANIFYGMIFNADQLFNDDPLAIYSLEEIINISKNTPGSGDQNIFYISPMYLTIVEGSQNISGIGRSGAGEFSYQITPPVYKVEIIS